MKTAVVTPRLGRHLNWGLKPLMNADGTLLKTIHKRDLACFRRAQCSLHRRMTDGSIAQRNSSEFRC